MTQRMLVETLVHLCRAVRSFVGAVAGAMEEAGAAAGVVTMALVPLVVEVLALVLELEVLEVLGPLEASLGFPLVPHPHPHLPPPWTRPLVQEQGHQPPCFPLAMPLQPPQCLVVVV